MTLSLSVMLTNCATAGFEKETDETQYRAIGAALICLICIQTVQGQTTTLRYGQIPSTIKTVSALQFYIAQRKGFFARERVSLQMVSIEGGAANMMAALDRGTIDITRTATFFLIQAALKGSEGVAIVGDTATPIYSLMVKPEIKTFANLKGKVVGLTNAVSTISVSMRKLLALHGLQQPTTESLSSLAHRSVPNA